MAEPKAAPTPVVAPVREAAVSGDLPLYQIPGWQEEYGLVAGITGRGTSEGRGFDLGLWTEAPVGEVMSRWRSFRRAHPRFTATILGNQVHGREIAWHEAGKGWIQLEGLDGHATATPGLLLTVTVADCIPVYLAIPSKRAIALLHCGWRGTAAGLLEAGIRLLTESTRSSAVEIVIHCGVGICGACYEVGREVMDGCGIKTPGSGPWHVDLRAVLADRARAMGVEKISTSQWCSGHDRPAFYSHRASGGRDGRMVAYLGIEP